MTAAADTPTTLARRFSYLLAHDLDYMLGNGLGGSPGVPADLLSALDAVDGVLVSCRVLVADRRAALIAKIAEATSTRQAAVDLGLSPSAVAKAVARARASERPE